MPHLSVHAILFAACVGAFTLLTAVRDLRTRKIPNVLTLPMFAAGLVYQAAVHGGSGLADAGLAFLLGFGTLFVLWIIGGGGGGDVKLMGALSVWLGFRMTLWVMAGSTLLVLLGTIAVLLWSLLHAGLRRTRGTSPDDRDAPRPQRRIMAYAVPVALATWAVVLWQLPRL